MEREEAIRPRVAAWLKQSSLHRESTCPACGSSGVMTGESLTRSPARIDENAGTIEREVRVLPNSFACPHCRLKLKGYQEMLEAGLGAIYTVLEEEDPIEFFGIDPEEHVDIEKLVKDYHDQGYMNRLRQLL